MIARLFGNDGLPASDEFTVNTYTSLGQYTPRVDTAADGSFVVVWASYDGRDGAGYGIFGQRFSPTGLPTGTEFAINQFTVGAQRRPAVAVTPTGFMVSGTVRETTARISVSRADSMIPPGFRSEMSSSSIPTITTISTGLTSPRTVTADLWLRGTASVSTATALR